MPSSSPAPGAAVLHGRRLAWGLVPLAAMAFLLSVTFPRTPPDPAAPAEAPAETEALPPARPALRREAGHRTVLPRPPALPVPEPTETSSQAAGAAVEDSGVLPEGGTMAPASVPFTPETVQAAMQDSLPEIEACVDAWLEMLDLEDALEGRLVAEVRLTATGVQEAVLLDVEGVPEPMRGCIGGAIYEVAWPQPEEETTIRYPFQLTETE